MARVQHAVRLVSLTALVLVLTGGPFTIERKLFRVGSNAALAEAGERFDDGLRKGSVGHDAAGDGAATRARALDVKVAPADPAGMETDRGARLRTNLAARDSRRKSGAKQAAAKSSSQRPEAALPQTSSPSSGRAEAETAAPRPAILARPATAAELSNQAVAREGTVTATLRSIASQIQELWRGFMTSQHARWIVGICLIGLPLASLVWPELIRRRRDERDLALFD